MIKSKGTLSVSDGRVLVQGLKLPDGDYNYIIYDNGKNRALPYLKYLYGVVLKTISDTMLSHPPVEVLYKYFERLYGREIICEIDGEPVAVYDLKGLLSLEEADKTIDNIVRHAHQKWGIQIPDRASLTAPECREAYIDSYTEMWKSKSNF